MVALLLIVGIFAVLPASASDRPRFHLECPFVRHRMADPIVHPGEPGAGHLHAFFGNKTTDAFSTFRSLRAGGSTCGHPGDRSAYWTPAVYSGGSIVRAIDADFYYRGTTEPSTAIRPFPSGLRIIAGNAAANGPQSRRIIEWSCSGGSNYSTRPPNCGGDYVRAHVRFPECWDGSRLDSRNHTAHMRYAVKSASGRSVCPGSHPVPVPMLELTFTFPVHDGSTISLATGKYFTMHADFINAWNRTALRGLVRRCIHAGIQCPAFTA